MTFRLGFRRHSPMRPMRPFIPSMTRQLAMEISGLTESRPSLRTVCSRPPSHRRRCATRPAAATVVVFAAVASQNVCWSSGANCAKPASLSRSRSHAAYLVKMPVAQNVFRYQRAAFCSAGGSEQIGLGMAILPLFFRDLSQLDALTWHARTCGESVDDLKRDDQYGRPRRQFDEPSASISPFRDHHPYIDTRRNSVALR